MNVPLRKSIITYGTLDLPELFKPIGGQSALTKSGSNVNRNKITGGGVARVRASVT